MSEAFQHQPPRVFASWGLWAVVSGAVAMALVFVQIQLLSSQESASIGQQIGEIAGEIRRSAWRSFLGLAPPVPEAETVAPTRTLFDAIYIAAPILAGIAIVLSAISVISRENWRLGFYGAALGGGAILFQYLWWMAVLILGFLLIFKIIENIGDIFGG